jgi:drug/metabolite transporter (DMT)-like permease
LIKSGFDIKTKAIFELVFAGCLWGFGFVATIWALKFFPSTQVVFYRFLLAWLAGFFIDVVILKKTRPLMKTEYLRALWPGILLCGFMFLQTYGMKTTTATKSSFITTLYVLFVPLLNAGLFKQKIHWIDFPLAALAIFGMYFLLGADLTSATFGDWITLGAAFVGALHIIIVGFSARASQEPFTFNNAQSFWVMLTSAVLLFLPEKNGGSDYFFSWSFSGMEPFLGILFLAFFSSLIAFTIQVRAQKVLSDQTATQLFLLEAPFSFLFAYLLLGDTLSPIQVTGACLILFSTFLSTRIEMKK